MQQLTVPTQEEFSALCEEVEKLQSKIDRLAIQKEASELLTTKEAAAYLKVTTTTIRNYAEKGIITPLRIGERNIRFEREDIKAALKAIQSRRRL